MRTHAAATADHVTRDIAEGAYLIGDLVRMGCTRAAVLANIDARRWQRLGRAVVVHNGELSRAERWSAAVLNCGPRAVLASFSAAEQLGLRGWERDDIHVLAPAGVAFRRVPGLPIVLHHARAIDTSSVLPVRRCQRIAPALVLAATGLANPRSACGIIAAAVQQRLTTAAELVTMIEKAQNIRHRRVLRAAAQDIAMGAEALSEIDFVRLCRRNGLPAPSLQAVRLDARGRRRYLDAEWKRGDGRRVAAEVDGALHLVARAWWNDQLRQNEVALSRTLVLRFPTVVMRTEEALVVDQLRRALFGRW